MLSYQCVVTCNLQTIVGDFVRQQQSFVSENEERNKQKDAAVPPWVGYNEEQAMKTQILALSSVSNTAIPSQLPHLTVC